MRTHQPVSCLGAGQERHEDKPNTRCHTPQALMFDPSPLRKVPRKKERKNRMGRNSAGTKSW